MEGQSKLQRFVKTFGPGILFASTAIGVSHLVQSTRAGADHGFALIWVVLLALLFKYPFFEYGSRYANATGESIIDGYKRIGKWFLVLYTLITLGSMFFVAAAVGFVTAGFMENLFGLNLPDQYKMVPTVVLFVVCFGILIIGKYKALDALIKVVGGVLLLSTLGAFAVTLFHGPVEPTADLFPALDWKAGATIPFVIALMGWMPTALDLSSWNSLWTLERIQQTKFKPSLKETIFEFNLGYLVTAVLAVCFVTLGAYIMFGTEQVLSNNNAVFAHSVVELYTATIGKWSYFIIAAAAFSVMFSTSIAVFDGYARSMERNYELLFKNEVKGRRIYTLWLLVVGFGALVIIFQFKSSLKALVDLATTISFLVAPIIAVANFYLVSNEFVPDEAVPSKPMRLLSYAGIIFLSGFSILYIYHKLPEWMDLFFR